MKFGSCLKRGDVLFVISIVLLLSLNVYWVSKVKRDRSSFEKLLKNLQVTNESQRNELNDDKRYINSILLDSKISSLKKQQLFFQYPNLEKELLEGDKVVFFYPKGACVSCLVKIYTDLEALSVDIGYNSILTMSEVKVEDNSMFQPSHFKFFAIESLGLEIERLNQPMLFIMDSDLDVKHLFIPDLFETARQDYFVRFLVQYFRK